jgi:hypothetical protein
MARRKDATRETLILVDEAENVTGFEERNPVISIRPASPSFFNLCCQFQGKNVD